jgi:1-hydroxycarotenoid 3,4-desaturase
MLAMGRANPFATMWAALGRNFHDPRLRQLFGRYATYCGSSPYQAPATLTLVAHVEQAGVWLVRGGMYRLAEAMAALAGRCGVELRYGTEVHALDAGSGRIAGVTLASGERLPADAAVLNTDVAAAVDGRLGMQESRAVRLPTSAERSLSAITWSVVAKTAGFPLHRHTVFFSRRYEPEFEALFKRSTVPDDPTVYVCAQDRGDASDPQPTGAERLLCLINAPATGDAGPMSGEALARCEARAFAQLERCGLRVEREAAATQVTTPHDFERLFPATGGALYGMASHGWRSAFQRPGCRTRLPGLYLAGGSVHPGPGVPMAALSGKMAAEALLSDLASTRR